MRMLVSYTTDQLAQDAGDIGDQLERGEIVHFPTCPVELPGEADLRFLLDELPSHLKLKNISYHPESGRVSGFKGEPALGERAQRILVTHSDRIESFLRGVMPELTRDWTVATSSFRPIQELGRDLSPHASNELVHIDAGAYGATNGDRILRFFVNVNPSEDRVWATKGTFPEVYERYGREAGIMPDDGQQWSPDKGPLDHLRTGLLKGLAAAGLREAAMIDSSPYDRRMRKFHNFMKDTPAFQQDMSAHHEIRFKPFSAWMVLTDMVSHASLSGQYAFVNTFLLRLERCRHPELTPYRILSAA